jgi:hypothetical protein
MRIIKFLSLVVALSTVFISCTKENSDKLSGDVTELGRGSYVTLAKANNLNIDYSNLANASVSIDIEGKGDPVDSVITYVSTNNTTTRSTWRRIRGFKVNDNKATLTITASQIATALGILPTALNPGSQYVLFNEVRATDGRIFSITNTNSEFESNVNYQQALRWTATIVCPFTAASAGTYLITVDPWDGATGELVSVTVPTATTAVVTYLYPYADAGGTPTQKPMTITVNPATGAATVASQVYGNYGAGFDNFAGSGSGFVFSCTGVITLNINHRAASGAGTNYGTFPIRLVKQ